MTGRPGAALSFAPHVRLGLALAEKHHRVARLKPAIVEMARRVSAGEGLPRAVAATFARFPDLADHFEGLGADVERAFGLRERYLFPTTDHVSTLRLENRSTDAAFTVDTSEIDLPSIGELLRHVATGVVDLEALRAAVGEPLAQLVPELVQGGFLSPLAEAGPLAAHTRPGVTRLQHASLLIASATTRILVDPHFSSLFVPDDLRGTMIASDWLPRIDGILVSHSHGDHWDLSSMMMVPRDTPVVVPRVPRASILAEDMGGLLTSAGFRRVHAPEWYGAPVRIGDITVYAYPFFGEQPLARKAGRSAELRNWGTTYYVQTPDFSIWVIVDAGDDAAGTMAGVADRIAAERGGVDFLASNLRSFAVGSGRASPTYITGMGHYWLALTPDQMASFGDFAEDITLGARGVAEVAMRAGARHVLPYAHWWRAASTRDAEEDDLAGRLAASLPAGGPRVIDWTIGERLLPRGTRLERARTT